MKVTITAMKAPWPEGSKVGDVVSFEGATLPGWALGKCVPASDNAKAGFQAAERSAPPADPVSDAEALRAQVQDLQAANEAGGKELQAALSENEALRAKLALPAVASILAAEDQAAHERAQIEAKAAKAKPKA